MDMMSFGIGRSFRMTVFGESHGRCVGALVDGCPAGIELGAGDIQRELDRRRPGRAAASTRAERDIVVVESGVTDGRTNGGPIMAIIRNEDTDPSWYAKNRGVPRPSHADYTAHVKYGGFSDWRGGGFFSGRITAGMVMGGAVAKKLLSRSGVRAVAHLVQAGAVKAGDVPDDGLDAMAAESPIWCADRRASEMMLKAIEEVRADGDSIGGIVECRIFGLPVGIGDPIFDSVESVLSHAVFSIPAVKGVEFGGGFPMSAMRGSEANDEFAIDGGRVVTRTNNSGGILGGITNGMPVVLRVAFKPTPSIGKEQRSVDLSRMEETTIRVGGRHDPCVAVRAVPVVEAVVSVGVADMIMNAHKIGSI